MWRAANGVEISAACELSRAIRIEVPGGTSSKIGIPGGRRAPARRSEESLATGSCAVWPSIESPRTWVYDCPATFARVGYGPANEVDIAIGTTLEVLAISVWRGVPFFLFIKSEMPQWLPLWLVAILEPTLPADWIVNPGFEDVDLLMGPKCVALTAKKYASLVNGERCAVIELQQYLDSRSGSNALSD